MSVYSIIKAGKSIPVDETSFYVGIFNMLGGYATTLGIDTARQYEIPDYTICAKYSFKHVYPAAWVYLHGHEIHVLCKFNSRDSFKCSFTLEEDGIIEGIRDTIIYCYNLALRRVLYGSAPSVGKRGDPDIAVSLELTYLDLKNSDWINR